MASAAANSALGTEVLAVQRLFYNITPNPATSIFMLFASQMVGYGIGGLMRCKLSPILGAEAISHSHLCFFISTYSYFVVPNKDAVPGSPSPHLHVRCLFRGREDKQEEAQTLLRRLRHVSFFLSDSLVCILKYSHRKRIFVWELFPEWIFPLLTGLSVFCLADQKNADFTRIFGGSNGNEGLGLLSLCFDWQYISGGNNPFASVYIKSHLI